MRTLELSSVGQAEQQSGGKQRTANREPEHVSLACVEIDGTCSALRTTSLRYRTQPEAEPLITYAYGG